METLVGKGLNDLAKLVSEKWYAGIGLVGLIMLLGAMLFDTPHDFQLTIYVALTMIGFGFGEAETRTFTMGIRGGFGRTWTVKEPHRAVTPFSVALYAMGIIAGAAAIWRAILIA